MVLLVAILLSIVAVVLTSYANKNLGVYTAGVLSGATIVAANLGAL